MHERVIKSIEDALAQFPRGLLNTRAPRSKHADAETLTGWVFGHLQQILEALGQDREAAMILARMLPSPWAPETPEDPWADEDERGRAAWARTFLYDPAVWLWGVWEAWPRVARPPRRGGAKSAPRGRALRGLPVWPGLDDLTKEREDGRTVNGFLSELRQAIDRRLSGEIVADKPGPAEAADYLRRALEDLRARLSGGGNGEPTRTPDNDPNLIYQSDAAEFYNIPKSTLANAAKKSPGTPGYLWSGTKGRRRFYRKKDMECLSRSRTRLRETGPR